jgi:hypothetical protein
MRDEKQEGISTSSKHKKEERRGGDAQYDTKFKGMMIVWCVTLVLAPLLTTRRKICEAAVITLTVLVLCIQHQDYAVGYLSYAVHQ